jgi:hypothetical protein
LLNKTKIDILDLAINIYFSQKYKNI